VSENYVNLVVFGSGAEALEALETLRDHDLVEANVWALHPVAYFFHVDRRVVLTAMKSRADEALRVLE
jgi:hypothetical protein